MRVFVAYAPGGYAGRAEDWRTMLQGRLGAEVYMAYSRPLDGDFQLELEKAVARCDVCLVLITPNWYVTPAIQLGIEAALRRRIPLIPVLLYGASLPAPGDLPDELAPLLDRYPFAIHDPSTRGSDVDQLLAAVVERVEWRRSRPRAEYSFEVPAPDLHGSSSVVASLLRTAVVYGVVPAGTLVLRPSLPLSTENAPPPAAPAPPPAAERPDVGRGELFSVDGDMQAPEGGGVSNIPGDQVMYLGCSRGWAGLVRVGIAVGAAAASLAVIYEVAKRVFGWFELSAEPGPTRGSEKPQGDVVDCTVFAPPSGAPGQSILVQVFAHLAEQTDDARALATEFDPGTRRRVFHSLRDVVPRGAKLTFELRIRKTRADVPVQSLVWRGRAESVQFEVALPRDLEEGTLIGTVLASLNGAPIGDVKFKLDVGPESQRGDRVPAGEDAVRYRAAFISYASADRDEVLMRLQMLNAVRIDYFEDLLDLEPGDRWWPRLQAAIDACDLFLLFWSSAAKRSPRVREEVEHALRRQAGDELSPPQIRPVILEGPPPVKPWDELAHLHFNDRVRYLMSPGAGTTGPPAS